MNKLEKIGLVSGLIICVCVCGFFTWEVFTGQTERDLQTESKNYQAVMSTNFTVQNGNNVVAFGVDQMIVSASALMLKGLSAEGTHIVSVYNSQQVKINETSVFVEAAQDFTVTIYENGTMTYQIVDHRHDFGL
jgi:hypothetical protein